jgi:hypothetical protein
LSASIKSGATGSRPMIPMMPHIRVDDLLKWPPQRKPPSR